MTQCKPKLWLKQARKWSPQILPGLLRGSDTIQCLEEDNTNYD